MIYQYCLNQINRENGAPFPLFMRNIKDIEVTQSKN